MDHASTTPCVAFDGMRSIAVGTLDDVARHAKAAHDRFPDAAILIFSETTAFGLRVEKIQRLKLARRFETVRTRYGEIIVKVGMKGTRVMQLAPEFESCLAAAELAGVPLREVHATALEVARNTIGIGLQGE